MSSSFVALTMSKLCEITKESTNNAGRFLVRKRKQTKDRSDQRASTSYAEPTYSTQPGQPGYFFQPDMAKQEGGPW